MGDHGYYYCVYCQDFLICGYSSVFYELDEFGYFFVANGDLF